MLYVPGSDERKLKKLTNLHVDCAVMDCEDGVALNRKVGPNQLSAGLWTKVCPHRILSGPHMTWDINVITLHVN